MQAAVVTAAFSVVRKNLFLDDAVKTARIKEGSVELHSMHCSMHCSVQVQKDTCTKNCGKCELDYECPVVAADASGKVTRAKERICPKCNSKRVLLCRMFTKWPIDSWNELSHEQQVDFWRSGNSKTDLQNALINAVSKQRINEEVNRDDGSYLPLSVYQTQGYATDTMEQTCPKKWDDELKEWTFKKTIRTDSTIDITKKCKEEIVNLRASDMRSTLSHYASPAKGKKRKGRKSSSSSNSSKSSKSSNSSNSSDSPATKKTKAAEKKKKESDKKKKESDKAKEAVKAAKEKAAEESRHAKLLATQQAKAQKAQDKLDEKQAAKDPIFIFMHMNRDILL